MAYTQKIVFYKIRNFSQKLNATIEFIRQNALSLGKSILYILGPLAILNGLLFSQYINFAFGNLSGQEPMDVQNPLAFMVNPSYIGFMFLSSFSALLNFSIIFNFMKLYIKKYPEEITVVEVLNASWKYLLPLFVLGTITTILGMMGFIAFLIPGFYLMVVFSLSIPALFFEDKGVFGSIGRGFQLIRGKWWSTFGLLFVASILMYAVSMISILPFYAFYFMSLFSLVEETGVAADTGSWWFQGGMTLSIMLMFLGSFLAYSIPMVALSFQYFNLVERRESLGLMSAIDQLETGDQEQ